MKLSELSVQLSEAEPFPGEIAGASLKLPCLIWASTLSGVRFPGEIAGASLKLLFH